MNVVVFSGRLVERPELKQTQNGVSVCSANIAVSDGYGDKEKTYYPTIIAWRKTAEYLCKYGEKGAFIMVKGKYTERKWEDQSGNKRKASEFLAEEIKLLNMNGKQPGNGGNSSSQNQSTGGDQVQGIFGNFDEVEPDSGDLPF